MTGQRVKSETRQLTEVVGARVFSQEKVEIEQAAARAGSSVSDWLREVALQAARAAS